MSFAVYGPVGHANESVVLNVTSTDAAVPPSSRCGRTASGGPRVHGGPLPGGAVPNHAYLKVGADEELAVFLNEDSNVIVDVFGYMV